MTVGTEVNSCHRGLGGGVLVCIGQMVMLMKKYWYLKVTKENQSWTGELFWFALNEVHGVTRDGDNHNFGDNLWGLGSI